MTEQEYNAGGGGGGLESPAQEALAPRDKGRSCLFWGCGGCLLLALLAVAGSGGCIYVGYRQLLSFTEEEGVVYEKIPDSPRRAGEIRSRIERFHQDLVAGETELILGADDLNILLLEHPDPDMAEYARFQRFRIADSVLLADVSLPMDWVIERLEMLEAGGRDQRPELKLGRAFFGLFEGRHFNASIELAIGISRGEVRVKIEKVVTGAGIEIGPEHLAGQQRGQQAPLADLERKVAAAFGELFSGRQNTRKELELRGKEMILSEGP